MEEYERAGKDQEVASLNKEIEILLEYLPQQLSEDEIRGMVQEAIAQTGAEGRSDIGVVMKTIMSRLKGQADGKVVNRIAMEELAN